MKIKKKSLLQRNEKTIPLSQNIILSILIQN